MPKKEERALKIRARKKGLSGTKKDAYVYGTLRKMGWKPKGERRLGKPRTNAERRARHKSLHGTSKLPPRGTGLN